MKNGTELGAYIVYEALDSVHRARNNDKISNIYFAWAKYLVSQDGHRSNH